MTNTLESIYRKIDAIEPDEYGCKIWPAVFTGRSPQVHIAGCGRYTVARLVLERKLGRPIKPGYNANHDCDNPRRVNENHLYEGTQEQNMRDKFERNFEFVEKHRARSREQMIKFNQSPEGRELARERANARWGHGRQ
jgi:hypothetical protein